MAGRLLADLAREPLSALPLQTFDYLVAGPVRVWRTARSMVRDTMVAKLPDVPHPTLVVRGARDPVAPRAWATRVAAILPAAAYAEVAGAAHLVNYSHPAALVNLTCQFLGQHGSVALPPVTTNLADPDPMVGKPTGSFRLTTPCTAQRETAEVTASGALDQIGQRERTAPV